MSRLTRDGITMDASNLISKEKPALSINGDNFEKVVLTLDGTTYSFSLKTFVKAIIKIMKEAENEDPV